MYVFVYVPIICDKQERELGSWHLKHQACPFFTYLIIACVKPADVPAPWCTERNQRRDNAEVEKSKERTRFNLGTNSN